MKYFMTLLMVFAVTLACIGVGNTAPVEKDKPVVGQLTPVNTLVRVYMIHDPVGNQWFRKNMFGLTAWGSQQQGYVWTTRSDAVSALAGILSDRGARCEIKAFLLIPAKDNK